MENSVNYTPHHTALSVRNLERSVAFYEGLGYKEVHRYDEPVGSLSIVHLKSGSSFLELFFYQANAQAAPLTVEQGNNLAQIGVKHIALQTDDVEAALEDMKQKGFADENTQITFGRTKVSYFFIQDPDGMWVEIVKDDRYY